MRTKSGARRFTIPLVAVLALLVGAGVPTAISQTEQTYEACHRNQGENLVRIVKSASECGAHETHFQFGQGTPGEPGPAGPPSEIGPGVEDEDTTVRLNREERLVLMAYDVGLSLPGYYFATATFTFRPHPRGGGEHVGVSCRFTTTPDAAPVDLSVFNDGPFVNATMIDQIQISPSVPTTPRIGVLCRSSITPFRPMQMLQGRLWVKLLEVDRG